MAAAAAFQDKVAVVTGGGSGIGEACALRFAAGGARVVIADRNHSAAQRVVQAIHDAGGVAGAIETDVSDPALASAMVEFSVRTFGRLDIAINNAGISGELKPIGELSPEAWLSVIDVDLSGVFYCMRAELPAMVRAGGGSIVNVASVLSTVGYANSSHYVSAKHGLLGLTRTAALEYGRHDIRINAVGPGFTRTPQLEANLDEGTT